MNNVNYSIFPNAIMFPPAIQDNFIEKISGILEDNNWDGYNKEHIELTKILENVAGCSNLYFKNKEIKGAIIVYNQFIEQYNKHCPIEKIIGSEGILLKKGENMCAILIENGSK